MILKCRKMIAQKVICGHLGLLLCWDCNLKSFSGGADTILHIRIAKIHFLYVIGTHPRGCGHYYYI